MFPKVTEQPHSGSGTIATHCSGGTSCQGYDGGQWCPKLQVLAPRRFLRHIVENVQKDLQHLYFYFPSK